MKLLSYFRLRWAVPCCLALLGLILFFFVKGCNFIGIFLLGIAALIICLNLLCSLKVKHRCVARMLKITLCVLLSIFIVMYTATFIMLLRAAHGDPEVACSYVLVLGARLDGNKPSPALQERLNKACEYLNAHPDAIAIVSGGQGSDEQISEAQCMFDTLTQMGIAPERIWLEDRATSTRENFLYSLQLLEEKTGALPEQICIISSEFHLFRSKFVAQQYGINAIAIPAHSEKSVLLLNHCLREVIAIWYYWIS